MEDDESDFPTVGGIDAQDYPVDLQSSQAVTPPAQMQGTLSPGDIRSVYAQAAELLKQQRQGLTGRQQLGALIQGFAQPVRGHRWQDMVVNATGNLSRQTQLSRVNEDKRRDQIAQLLLRSRMNENTNAKALEVARINHAGDAQKAADKATAAAQKAANGEIVVLQDPNNGELHAARKHFVNGAPAVESVPIAELSAQAPTISTPQEAAQHPEAPIVNTPNGPMTNPYYKGG